VKAEFGRGGGEGRWRVCQKVCRRGGPRVIVTKKFLWKKSLWRKDGDVRVMRGRVGVAHKVGGFTQVKFVERRKRTSFRYRIGCVRTQREGGEEGSGSKSDGGSLGGMPMRGRRKMGSGVGGLGGGEGEPGKKRLLRFTRVSTEATGRVLSLCV